jgi:thiol-disulfide isomerase/thioredoxin
MTRPARLLFVAGLCAALPAQESRPESRAALDIGGRAPALAGATWVKGGPESSFEKSRVYVVDFWSTWCPPCVAGMKDLTALQRKHAGRVTVIGVTSADERNTLEAVKTLVEKKGDEVGYAIAWDPDRKAWSAWLDAAGLEGLPWAFVVNGDGVVAFIGSPEKLPGALEQIVAGTWDLAQAAAARRDERSRAARDKALQDRVLDLLDRARKGGRADAYAALSSLIDGDAKTEAGALLAIASGLTEIETDRGSPGLSVALKAAERAVALDEKGWSALDALAAVWFKKGDASKAAEIELRALEHAEEGAKVYLRLNLKKYERGAETRR